MNEQPMGEVLEQLGKTLKDMADAIKRLESRIEKLEAKTSFVMVGPTFNQPDEKPIVWPVVPVPMGGTGDPMPLPTVVIS